MNQGILFLYHLLSLFPNVSQVDFSPFIFAFVSQKLAKFVALIRVQIVHVVE